MKKQLKAYIVNVGLLISAIISAFSGLLLQIQFHMGNHGHASNRGHVLGMSYHDWLDIHKISIIILTICMVFHCMSHWKWYKIVIQKKLFSKNRQVLIVSLLFVLVAITGFIPWIIYLLEGNNIIRNSIIEIHDKLTILFIIYLLIHIIKRRNWYVKNLPV